MSLLSRLVRYFRNKYQVRSIGVADGRINTSTVAQMTRMTGPDCAVMYNLITHTHTHTDERFSKQISLTPLGRITASGIDRMTRMTGPDCAVMFNLRNMYTHTPDQRFS